MKTLLLAGAVMAAVGCGSEPAAVHIVPTPKTSTDPGSPSQLGSVDPNADMPESVGTFLPSEPPETTTTTEAPEPITCPGYGHPTHHLSCDEAAAAVARRAPVDYDVPSPQSRSTGRGSEPAGGDTPPDSVKQCESGGSYTAVNPNGHYGAWQFSQSTWESVGGTGRPDHASPAEQDRRAAILWNGGAGASHWECA